MNGDDLAIQLAMQRRQPLYFIKSNMGTTLEVCVHPQSAYLVANEYRQQKVPVRVYERRGSALNYCPKI